MSPQVGDVLVAVRADIGQFRSSMDQVAKATTSVGHAAEGSHGGISRLERVLGTLAFQAAGVPNELGHIASVLLSMSAGSALTIAVVAGIGAVGLAFEGLGKAAEETRKNIEALIKTSDESDFGAIAAKIPLQLQLANIQAQQARLKALPASMVFDPASPFMPVAVKTELDELQEKSNNIVAAFQRVSTKAKEAAETLSGPLNSALAGLNATLKAIQPDLDHLYKGLVNPVTLEKFRQVWAGWNAELEDSRAQVAQLGQLMQSLQTPAEKFGESVALIMKAVEDGLILADTASELLQKSLNKLLEGQGEKDSASKLGESLGDLFARSFIRSAFDGFKGFGAMLKNLLASALEDAVLAGLHAAFASSGSKKGGSLISSIIGAGATIAGAIIGGPGGAAAGGAAGKEVAGGFFGAPPIVLSGPPMAATNPLAAVRDAEWMKFLSLSIRNYADAGGRLG